MNQISTRRESLNSLSKMDSLFKIDLTKVTRSASQTAVEGEAPGKKRRRKTKKKRKKRSLFKYHSQESLVDGIHRNSGGFRRVSQYANRAFACNNVSSRDHVLIGHSRYVRALNRDRPTLFFSLSLFHSFPLTVSTHFTFANSSPPGDAYVARFSRQGDTSRRL